MEFGMLSSNPEAQLELMNTMLQLEQLTAVLPEHRMVVPSTPTSPCMSAPYHHFSSPAASHVSAGAGAGSEGYGGDVYSGQSQQLPAAAAAAAAYTPASTRAQTAAVAGGGGEVGSAAMREMIFHIAALQPVNIDPDTVRPPKRRNVRISTDPQSVAARMRRERISERIRILQRLVPGGTKMDTASMLDEAIHYVKFLKTQVQSLERAAAANGHHRPPAPYPGLNGQW